MEYEEEEDYDQYEQQHETFNHTASAAAPAPPAGTASSRIPNALLADPNTILSLPRSGDIIIPSNRKKRRRSTTVWGGVRLSEIGVKSMRDLGIGTGGTRMN